MFVGLCRRRMRNIAAKRQNATTAMVTPRKTPPPSRINAERIRRKSCCAIAKPNASRSDPTDPMPSDVESPVSRKLRCSGGGCELVIVKPSNGLGSLDQLLSLFAPRTYVLIAERSTTIRQLFPERCLACPTPPRNGANQRRITTHCTNGTASCNTSEGVPAWMPDFAACFVGWLGPTLPRQNKVANHYCSSSGSPCPSMLKSNTR